MLALLGLSFLGCGTSAFSVDTAVKDQMADPVPSDVTVPGTYAFLVDVDPVTQEPTITLPDGTVTHSYEVYASDVASIVAKDPDAEFDVSLGEHLSDQITSDLGTTIPDIVIGDTGDTAEDEPPPPWGPYYVGSYVLTGGLGSGYIGGCIKRNQTKYNVRMNLVTGPQVFDIHVLAWKDATRGLCGGVYESVSKGCWTTCSSSITSWVYSSIYAACIAVGLNAATSAAIEYIAAPVAVAALAI